MTRPNDILPTSTRLRELLHYEPETGHLCWRVQRGGMVPGAIAGTQKQDGYRYVKVDRILLSASRLIWCWMTGQWPELEIDHRDRNPGNNKWKNLRLATPSQNKANQQLKKQNTSGVRGVCWDGRRQKWKAAIKVGKRSKNLGRFDTIQEAATAYARAAELAFGEFVPR